MHLRWAIRNKRERRKKDEEDEDEDGDGDEDEDKDEDEEDEVDEVSTCAFVSFHILMLSFCCFCHTRKKKPLRIPELISQ